MSLKDKRTQSMKIESPNPELIIEAEELEKARNEIRNLENELTEVKQEREDLTKILDLKIPDTKRIEKWEQIKKDEHVRMLEQKILLLDHEKRNFQAEVMRQQNKIDLLEQDRLATMDRYQLDQEWQRISTVVKEKQQELEKLQRALDTVQIMKKQEVEDLNTVREKYNHECDRIQQICAYKREIMQDYSDLKKKINLPPLPDQLPKFPEKRSRNIFVKIFRRGK